MANPETQTYEEGRKLAAGWISTDQAPLVADTYYQGMLLEYDDVTNDAYQALSAGTLAGIYNGPDGDTVTTGAERNIIVAGEISASGLVDATGASLTLTEDQKAAYRDAGFYIKGE